MLRQKRERSDPMDILQMLRQPFTPPAVSADIPHGDMPGDKVVISEGHIAKANAIYPRLAQLLCGALEQNPARRAVIAVCGGSGGDLYPFAIGAGADAYVTANIKHNLFIEMRRDDFCVLDAGHFCTENTVIKPLAEKAAKAFQDTEIIVSESSEDPARYYAR